MFNQKMVRTLHKTPEIKPSVVVFASLLITRETTLFSVNYVIVII